MSKWSKTELKAWLALASEDPIFSRKNTGFWQLYAGF